MNGNMVWILAALVALGVFILGSMDKKNGSDQNRGDSCGTDHRRKNHTIKPA